ncbi:MAG TPA: molybdopterin dinucleotide binding domain-containing protein [Acidimicrobiia bacterium]|nr:molybdopterin dinucleotide binding domain-containing protein [Acidimicrobiia bacterium]
MTEIPRLIPGSGLTNFPPADRWDDWQEYDARAWPEKIARNYRLVPTTCFNCESACGLLAYVDKDTGDVRKFEGNPAHPGSRGRNCAKGPATLNQMYDPERILHPLRRVGERGSGEWEQITWEEALTEIGTRIGRAIREGRHDEIMYHVGRPGEDGFMDRTLRAWGVDGHNSHTNICSSGARTGYAMWMGWDRPSADFANAAFILLLSSHLETGHYFNPHAQRIMEGKQAGAKLATIDPRLSNTASMSDYWLSTWPGTEPALFLAIARLLIEWDAIDHRFVQRWVNWRETLSARFPELEQTYEEFVGVLARVYASYTPEWAAEECGIEPQQIESVAREIAKAGSRFASHTWRSTGSGNLGGWQAARTLWLLHVLTGSIGTVGGTAPSAWDKFKPEHWNMPPPHSRWNELLWPAEYPLAHHEMSFLLPYLTREGRGNIDVYFTRVYNPIWTNPDGFSWMEMLTDPDRIGLHVALTPTWSESAWFADLVLPMGVGSERHDTHSYETHMGQWLGFRQPVLRVAGERDGKTFERTHEANPGEVWEETEFWIDLSWKIDPDGTLGIRRWFESPSDPTRPVTVDEYYGWMFDNSVPGLPERAAAEGLDPLGFMRKYGAIEVARDIYQVHEREATDGLAMDDGTVRHGFRSPSKKLEWWSETMHDWGWPDEAIPTYLESHVHWRKLDLDSNERILLPIFRLPTLIHTRSGNAKYLYEISHGHPLWMNPADAEALGLSTGDLVRISTETGHFVIRVWRTEGIRPGVVAASHHMGRWRLQDGTGNERWSSALVEIEKTDETTWRLRQKKGIEPFTSEDPDSERIWWRDAGVHQNLAFPPHPDPVSGMHAWHQRVRISPAEADDRYGDVVVDTAKSFEIYRRWLELARPGPGPGGLRRPLWLDRPVKPTEDAYRV